MAGMANEKSTAGVRLLGADDAPILARPFYGEGPTSPIVTSLAQVPEMLEATMPFIATVLGPSALGARTKEIVILRTSVLLECSYCVKSHTVVALDSGLSRDEAEALREEAPVDGAFTDQGERVLVAFVDAVAGAAGPVDPLVRSEIARLWGEPALVELTLLCAATVMLNRYCTALELPVTAATLSRLAGEGLA